MQWQHSTTRWQYETTTLKEATGRWCTSSPVECKPSTTSPASSCIYLSRRFPLLSYISSKIMFPCIFAPIQQMLSACTKGSAPNFCQQYNQSHMQTVSTTFTVDYTLQQTLVYPRHPHCRLQAQAMCKPPSHNDLAPPDDLRESGLGSQIWRSDPSSRGITASQNKHKTLSSFRLNLQSCHQSVQRMIIPEQHTLKTSSYDDKNNG